MPPSAHRLPTCALALCLLLGAPLSAQDVAWTVFADETVIRTAPHADAPEAGRLSQGATVGGEIVENAETGAQWLAFERDGRTLHVSMNALMRVHPDNVCDGDLPIGQEVVSRWWGLPLDHEPSDLVEIPQRLSVHHDRTYRLRREARDALVEMLDAALRDDVDIQVISAHRSAATQRWIFEHAIERHGPGQRTAARPGHSEHQLGTAVDLSDPTARFATDPAFADTPQGRWLAEHAAEFGFVQSYTEQNTDKTGYQPEPWHFRYMGR